MLRILLPLLIVWTVDAVAMAITIDLLPDVTVTGASTLGAAAAALLPAVILVVVLVVVGIVLRALVQGAAITIESIMQDVGL